jgi:alpha-glucosidase
MRDVPVPPDRVQDPWERNVPGQGFGRDPVRSPMPWDRGANAGFCRAGATPWLPIDADAPALSVAAQREDPGSLLTLYRDLLALRRAEPALAAGTHRTVAASEDGALVYERSLGDDVFAVALNLGAEPVGAFAGTGSVALATARGREGERVHGPVELAGGEAIVIRRWR